MALFPANDDSDDDDDDAAPGLGMMPPRTDCVELGWLDASRVVRTWDNRMACWRLLGGGGGGGGGDGGDGRDAQPALIGRH